MKIVLVEPKIPPNTGTIARLCAANYIQLDLVGELGFSLDDSHLKRAGLDYWGEVNYEHFPDANAYMSSLNRDHSFLFTTKVHRPYTDASYTDNSVLIFGSETEGLSDSIRTRFINDCCRLPMENPNVRSLNLSNAVAVVLYHAKYS